MLGSGVAQRKRGGLITRRSVDQNHSPLNFFVLFICFFFVFKKKEKRKTKQNFIGGSGFRSPCLTDANGALYQLS